MIRSNLADYGCLVPSSVEEALLQKAEVPGLIPIAGGTEVMVWLNEGRAPGKVYQSLHRLAPEWRHIHPTAEGGIRIGALATYTDVRHHKALIAQYPLFTESSRMTGALQIQNRGTLVGNIANGSPAADSAPVLLIYDAIVHIASKRGTRDVSFSEFQTGYRKNVLAADELITGLTLPPSPFVGGLLHYRKVGTREAQAISKVVFAGARSADGKIVRMAWGSVAATTIRTRQTEALLEAGAPIEDALATLQTEINPLDDIRSTAKYRRQVAGRILREFVGKFEYLSKQI